MAQSIQNVNGGYNSSAGAVSSHSSNITLGIGTSRKIVVAIAKEASQTVTALTFDGTSILANASATITHSVSTTLSVSFFYYDVPDVKATGTYAVVATTSGTTANLSMYVWQSVNSATGAPEATTTAEATEVSSTPVLVTSSLTVTTGALLLACFAHNDAAVTWDTYSSPITERTEQNETNYTSACADGVQGSSGSKTVSCTNSGASNGYRKILAAVSIADATPSAPTIDSQPTAQTVVLAGPVSNNPCTFTVAATTSAGSLTYDWELESGVGTGVYANLSDGNGATWTGQTSASCSATLTATALSGRRVRCNVTDDNGTTTTSAVALTIYAGTTIAQPAATDGSGQATAVLTTDVVDSTNGQLKLITFTRGSTVLRTTARKTS